jgi:hypothetical protein
MISKIVKNEKVLHIFKYNWPIKIKIQFLSKQIFLQKGHSLYERFPQNTKFYKLIKGSAVSWTINGLW